MTCTLVVAGACKKILSSLKQALHNTSEPNCLSTLITYGLHYDKYHCHIRVIITKKQYLFQNYWISQVFLEEKTDHSSSRLRNRFASYHDENAFGSGEAGADQDRLHPFCSNYNVRIVRKIKWQYQRVVILSAAIFWKRFNFWRPVYSSIVDVFYCYQLLWSFEVTRV